MWEHYIYYEDEPCVTLNTMLTDVELTKFSKMKLNEWDSICGGCCYCCLLSEECQEACHCWNALNAQYIVTETSNTIQIQLDLLNVSLILYPYMNRSPDELFKYVTLSFSNSLINCGALHFEISFYSFCKVIGAIQSM